MANLHEIGLFEQPPSQAGGDRETEAHAGIERDEFMDYFAGRDVGYAIKIGGVKRHDQPRNLQEAYGVRPPQSFLYL